MDSEIGRNRPPLLITNVTAPFYASVTDPLRDLGKYFDGLPFMSGGGSKSNGKDESHGGGAASKPSLVRLPSGIEVSKPPHDQTPFCQCTANVMADARGEINVSQMMGPEGQEKLQGSRGERRVNALNPHGNIDFMLPSAGMSEYLGKRLLHILSILVLAPLY